MRMNDYHVHTFLCKHAEGQVYEYVESAIKKGVEQIGFAEHIPIRGLHDPDGRMRIDEFELYLKFIKEAQKKYKEIKILLGIEADYMPVHMSFIEDFLNQYTFDFIIGSVHFIDEWDFTNPLYQKHYENYDIDHTYRQYYKLVREAAGTGLYDIIGHFDIPKKFGYRATVDLSRDINETLKIIKDNDLVLDVNTSGLRKPVKEIHPSEKILQQALEYNIPVILGSDAHQPSHVAYAFEETRDLLKKIGFSETCVYDKRKRKSIPL